jgi:hypothetical protein
MWLALFFLRVYENQQTEKIMPSSSDSGPGPQPLFPHPGEKNSAEGSHPRRVIPRTRGRTPRDLALRRVGVPQVAVPRPSQKGAEPDANTRGLSEAPVHLPATEIDFAELEDGSLVELVEDPKDPLHTLLAVWKDGHLEYTDQLEHNGRIFVPLQRKGEILKRVRLPREAKSYESVQSLRTEIRALLKRCVVLDYWYTAVLPHFVLSTWLVDRLPVAPYLSVVGLPQSGKTTLLKVLSLVCRRPLLTADITSAAFYQACSQLMPTLLIDEAGTHQSNRVLRHLLRVGTTRDVVAMRKNQSFHAYGAKAISWLEPPEDPALNSRCILVPMFEANNSSLARPTDPALEEQAARLQAQLLQFRLDKYKSVELPNIPGAESLRPRARDLLTCLAAPCAENPNTFEYLLWFFKRQAEFTKEPLSLPEDAVLRALFYLAHQRLGPEKVVVGDLTHMVNKLLARTGERFRLSPRKVGAVLTSLGFIYRQRTNLGWTVWLDRSQQKRVHELAQAHGMERFKLDLPVSTEECPLCERPKFPALGPDQKAHRKDLVDVVDNIGFWSSEASERKSGAVKGLLKKPGARSATG